MTNTAYKDIDAVVLQDYQDPLPSHCEGIRLASITEQADLAEEAGTHGLYCCLDPWAIRHRFISRDNGDVIRARCDRWTCEYCGPRKTDLWRQLIAAAEPVLFITLSRAGNTVEAAARRLTTFIQYLRRGSKGRGKNHIGARPAYVVEYFGALERHENFEETGFHWHLLINGVDYIPKDILDAAWESATGGLNKWAFVRSVKNHRAIGYVTKYLTKDVTRSEKGTRQEQRDMLVMGTDEQGHKIVQRQEYTVEVESHARRIRYSRRFFPMSVEELRHKLFAGLNDPESIERDNEPAGPVVDAEAAACPVSEAVAAEQEQVTTEPEQKKKSSWMLYEAEPFTDDYQEYKRRCRRALLEKLQEVRAGQWRISGRVLSVWSFQRSQRRRAG